ncbi:hypothetical protein [Clostridium pasteurianum]|uniref:Uncharacterized protein n=1 Tax=Clostridium pasteurianum BC1 TaxID=86416 RepID=R4K4C5_CLOPA|nr:hypothetical protein [Clostridium pasteurianum]AGK95394.1 hypothetical protein Clopa_0332 [Clostridium pasteurianum BC1]
MRIGDILRENDVGNYNKLMKVRDKKKYRDLNESDIKELMSHSTYRRHKGAIKQVR